MCAGSYCLLIGNFQPLTQRNISETRLSSKEHYGVAYWLGAGLGCVFEMFYLTLEINVSLAESITTVYRKYANV